VITDTVRRVWDVEAIAQRHREFLGRWGRADLERVRGEASPLALRTMITADWLELLRGDPRLPREHLPEAWPADESHDLMSRWRARLIEPSNAQLRTIRGV